MSSALAVVATFLSTISAAPSLLAITPLVSTTPALIVTMPSARVAIVAEPLRASIASLSNLATEPAVSPSPVNTLRISVKLAFSWYALRTLSIPTLVLRACTAEEEMLTWKSESSTADLVESLKKRICSVVASQVTFLIPKVFALSMYSFKRPSYVLKPW